MSVYTCGSQETTLWTWFLPSTMWVLGIELGLSDLLISLYPLGHLAGPLFNWIFKTRSHYLVRVALNLGSFWPGRYSYTGHNCVPIGGYRKYRIFVLSMVFLFPGALSLCRLELLLEIIFLLEWLLPCIYYLLWECLYFTFTYFRDSFFYPNGSFS